MTQILRSTDGYPIVLDDEDYAEVSKYRWNTCHSRGTRYAHRTVCSEGKQRDIRLHRQLLNLNPGDGIQVDHINGDGLDNRRCNLRTCTRVQNHANMCNRKRRSSASGFIGVYRSQRDTGWEAHIQYSGRPIYCGLFKDPADAARARDKKAIELLGEFAILNFPVPSAVTTFKLNLNHGGMA